MIVLVVVPDYASHWYPLSAVAEALRARGHRVVVATGQPDLRRSAARALVWFGPEVASVTLIYTLAQSQSAFLWLSYASPVIVHAFRFSTMRRATSTRSGQSWAS